MSDDVLQKRKAVRQAYYGQKWYNKVDKMTDSQIIAVYLRLKNQNKV